MVQAVVELRNRDWRGVLILAELGRIFAPRADIKELQFVGEVDPHVAHDAPAVEILVLEGGIRFEGRLRGRRGSIEEVGVADIPPIAAVDARAERIAAIGAGRDEATVEVDPAPVLAGKPEGLARARAGRRKGLARIEHRIGRAYRQARSQQHGRRRFRALTRIIAGKIDFDGFHRRPPQREASGNDRLAALRADDGPRTARVVRGNILGGVTDAVVEQVDITVPALADTRDAGGKLIVDPEVRHAADVDPVERPVCRLHVSRAVAPGLGAEQLDGATDRILARQRALRPAQDLDTIEVHQFEQRARQRRDEHVVDIDADARIERIVEVGLADTADIGDQAGAAVLRLRRQRDVRGLRGDLADVRLPACFQHRRIDRGDGDRRVLQPLLAELRGDDDIGVPGRLVGGRCRFRLRLRGGGSDVLRECRRCRGDRHGQNRHECHWSRNHQAPPLMTLAIESSLLGAIISQVSGVDYCNQATIRRNRQTFDSRREVDD